MKPAIDLLHNLRDFGWPLLAYTVIAPVPTYLVWSRRSREERTSRLLFVFGIIAVCESVFLLGTSGSLILQITRLHPVWGLYVACLVSAVVIVVTIWTIQTAKTNRQLLNLHDSQAQDPIFSASFAVGTLAVCLLGFVGAFIWLVLIAHGS